MNLKMNPLQMEHMYHADLATDNADMMLTYDDTGTENQLQTTNFTSCGQVIVFIKEL